ncbi:hypothetical protein GA0061091_11176 [Gordonia sp. v-85]|nr:hypothetical protein GA0061091_11176 [Gordonia sp. v-85]
MLVGSGVGSDGDTARGWTSRWGSPRSRGRLGRRPQDRPGPCSRERCRVRTRTCSGCIPCHLKADEDSDAQKHFAVPRSGLLVLVPNGNYASVVRWGATELTSVDPWSDVRAQPLLPEVRAKRATKGRRSSSHRALRGSSLSLLAPQGTGVRSFFRISRERGMEPFGRRTRPSVCDPDTHRSFRPHPARARGACRILRSRPRRGGDPRSPGVSGSWRVRHCGRVPVVVAGVTTPGGATRPQAIIGRGRLPPSPRRRPSPRSSPSVRISGRCAARRRGSGASGPSPCRVG